MAFTKRTIFAATTAIAVSVTIAIPLAAFGASDDAQSGVGDALCVVTADGSPFNASSEVKSCGGSIATPTPPPSDPGGGTEPSVEHGDPSVDMADVRVARGSRAVGASTYPVPSSAVFVASGSSTAGTGTAANPFPTIQKAVDRAATGTTIVVRKGVYRESITTPREKKLTIQAYPGEEVWLDGSKPVTEWQKSGAVWVSSGWTTEFDTSPTYKRGAPDNTTAAWSFLNASYPLAAHPDQVWFGNVAMKQVSSLGAITTGTFFVDRGADQLIVGSDPRNKSVAASVLVNAIRVTGADATIRGIGVRRYAPSVPDMGAVAVYGNGVTIENVIINDSATTGLSINAAHATVNDVTIARSGMLGMHANYADYLTVRGLLSADNNSEHFNRAPVAGGLKVTRSRTVSVTDSIFLRNDGNALWFDESVWNGNASSNDILDNTGSGIVVELSAQFVIANNVIARNARSGVLIDGSGTINVWNNTIVGNDRAIKIAQGDRRASNLATAGHDPRQNYPDPTVTWLTENITVGNNVLSTAFGNCILGVEDYSHERSAAQMRIVSDGNIFHRTLPTKPAWAIVWSRGVGDPAVYTSLAAFTNATGQDRRSASVDGQTVLGAGWSLTSTLAARTNSIAVGVPAAANDATGGQLSLPAVGAITR